MGFHATSAALAATALTAATIAIAVASASAIAATTVAITVASASASAALALTTVVLGELRGLNVQPGGVGYSAWQRGLRQRELRSADPVGASRRGRHCGLCGVQ